MHQELFMIREKGLQNYLGQKNRSRLCLQWNSTESLNIAIKGLIEPGDHVITTMLEHNSVLRPLYEMEERGAKLTIIKQQAGGNFSLEDMERDHAKDKSYSMYQWFQSYRKLCGCCTVGEMAHRHGVL